MPANKNNIHFQHITWFYTLQIFQLPCFKVFNKANINRGSRKLLEKMWMRSSEYEMCVSTAYKIENGKFLFLQTVHNMLNASENEKETTLQSIEI